MSKKTQGCLQETNNFRYKDIHRLKVEMEKDIPSKWKTKESWGTYTYIRQNRL